MKNIGKLNLRLGLIILLLISAASSPMHAQENFKLQVAGGGGFTIGYGYMGVSKLHDFVPASVGSFRNAQLVIGGTGHGFIGNFIIGGSGYGIIGDMIKTDSFRYSLGGGLGTFDFGYLIF